MNVSHIFGQSEKKSRKISDFTTIVRFITLRIVYTVVVNERRDCYVVRSAHCSVHSCYLSDQTQKRPDHSFRVVCHPVFPHRRHPGFGEKL